MSIVTPVFNGATYLDELIESVLRQDYPHFEHIIVDDGSSDDGTTVALLKRYPHLRWWSQAHKGQFATLNDGLAAARGDIVGIISADDRYVAPSAFGAVVRHWHLHPELGCIYGQALRMDAKGNPLPFVPPMNKGPFAAWMLRYPTTISHCALFVAKALVLERNIWFDPSYRYAGDWDWIIRLSMAAKFGYLDQCLAHYREHTSQASRRMDKDIFEREYRKILRQYGVNPAICFLLIWRKRILTGLEVLRRHGLQGLARALKEWQVRSARA